MKIKFYGVRGSIASAGESTRRYGGNTSCVAVEAGGEVIVFDAGTGIRNLGCDLGPSAVRSHLFFSHLHWDHIQGFPFFTPAFIPGNEIHVHHVALDEDVGAEAVLRSQMQAPTFPVGMDIMRADLRFHAVGVGDAVSVGAARVTHMPVDHPNGCVAYRVQLGGRSLVYATDLEHPEAGFHPALAELCQDADWLIYDAMYTPEEYEGQHGFSRRGWGHSTFEAGARLAEVARVKNLCLFHHDPAHDDAFMDDLGARARRRFTHTIVAAEGLEIIV